MSKYSILCQTILYCVKLFYSIYITFYNWLKIARENMFVYGLPCCVCSCGPEVYAGDERVTSGLEATEHPVVIHA